MAHPVRWHPVRDSLEVPTPNATASKLSKPQRHFSDLPSAVDLRIRDGVLRIEGAGFVTLTMVEEALAPFPGGRGMPEHVLIDLRNVAGYEASCVEVARTWLERSRGYGVERIAFIANSSVVRTAADVVAQHQGAPLRTFVSPRDAETWMSMTAERLPPRVGASPGGPSGPSRRPRA